MTKLRTFFALPVGEDDKPSLVEAIEKMRQAAGATRLRPRFIVSEQLHLTLKFMGFVEEELVPRLREIGARHAAKHDVFELDWTEVIAFGGPRRARALVAEIAPDEARRIATLAREMEDDVEPLGIERETRAYRPHVTLARLKEPGDARSLLEAAAMEPCKLRFTELRLYQSVQTREGGAYSVIETWPFGRQA